MRERALMLVTYFLYLLLYVLTCALGNVTNVSSVHVITYYSVPYSHFCFCTCLPVHWELLHLYTSTTFHYCTCTAVHRLSIDTFYFGAGACLFPVVLPAMHAHAKIKFAQNAAKPLAAM
jgi:hypothetical protein